MRGQQNAKPVEVDGVVYPSTGEAIRSLHELGWSRADIAKATGAPIHFVSSTLLAAVRAWPVDKKRRIENILLRSLETIADMTGIHGEDLITFALETIRRERDNRVKESSTPKPAPEPEPEPKPKPKPAPEPRPVIVIPPKPAPVHRSRPEVRTVPMRRGEDPSKLFCLRNPEGGEWLHQAIVDADEATVTTIGKVYRYTGTAATIQRLKAKWPRFAHWVLVPLVQEI